MLLREIAMANMSSYLVGFLFQLTISPCIISLLRQYLNEQRAVNSRQNFYVYNDMIEKNTPSEIFPKRLRAIRDTREWSQSDLAKRADLPPSSIAHFETGSRKPSFDTLRRLATALEVTTDYLLGRVEDPALAEAGDPLFRDIGNLTGSDRELAKDFLKMLADRSPAKRKGGT